VEMWLNSLIVRGRSNNIAESCNSSIALAVPKVKDFSLHYETKANIGVLTFDKKGIEWKESVIQNSGIPASEWTVKKPRTGCHCLVAKGDMYCTNGKCSCFSNNVLCTEKCKCKGGITCAHSKSLQISDTSEQNTQTENTQDENPDSQNVALANKISIHQPDELARSNIECRMLQIATYKVSNKEKFATFINPGIVQIPQAVSNKTKITIDSIQNAPAWPSV